MCLGTAGSGLWYVDYQEVNKAHLHLLCPLLFAILFISLKLSFQFVFLTFFQLKCVTDYDAGVSGSTCGGLASHNLEEAGQLYADPLECCKSQLGWIYEEFCVRDSLGNSCYAGSRKFYRDPENQNVCVRDCEKSASEPQCGGLVEDAPIRTYEDAR